MSLTLLFIFSVFSFFVVGGLFRPIFAVLGYLAVYLLYSPETWWGAKIVQTILRPSFVSMIFLSISALLNAKKLNWQFSRREIEFYIFLGIALMVSLLSPFGLQDENWIYLEKLLKIFVFIFLFLRIVDSMTSFKMVVWLFILGALFLSIKAQLATSSYFYESRLNRLGGVDFSEANQFASFLAMAITFAGFQMLRVRLLYKGLLVAGIVLMMNSIIMTQSRAVLMGIAMSVPILLIIFPKKYRKHAFLAAGLGVVLFFLLADVKFIDRMRSIRESADIVGENFGTTQEALTRWDYWKTSLKIFADHPLGIGVKNFETIVPYYDPRNPGMDAHSTYVLCYSELGIFGIAIFLIIIAETFYQFKRIRRMAASTKFENELLMHNTAITGTLLIYLLGIMVTHSILYSEILWMILALPICLENAAKKLL